MTYRQASKLHNRDEVILKETDEVGYVLSVRLRDDADGKRVELACQFPRSGYCEVTHRDVS